MRSLLKFCSNEFDCKVVKFKKKEKLILFVLKKVNDQRLSRENFRILIL